MDRAKFSTTGPENFRQAGEKGESLNPRKHFKGGKRHPSGKSGKGRVKSKKGSTHRDGYRSS